MKKILTLLFAVVCLTACNQHESISFSETASEGIQGTYEGTWTRSLNDDSVSGPGTISFTATDDAHIAIVAATCAEPAINKQGIANVSHADHEYVFYNNSVSDEAGFGARFSGRVYKNGTVDMQYSVAEQVGRFTNTYTFTFVGKKQ